MRPPTPRYRVFPPTWWRVSFALWTSPGQTRQDCAGSTISFLDGARVGCFRVLLALGLFCAPGRLAGALLDALGSAGERERLSDRVGFGCRRRGHVAGSSINLEAPERERERLSDRVGFAPRFFFFFFRVQAARNEKGSGPWTRTPRSGVVSSLLSGVTC